MEYNDSLGNDRQQKMAEYMQRESEDNAPPLCLVCVNVSVLPSIEPCKSCLSGGKCHYERYQPPVSNGYTRRW